MRALVVALAVPALLAGPAWAQQETGSEPETGRKKIVYEKDELIDFETPVVIEGVTKKPMGLYVTGSGPAKIPSMIDERVHFKRELAKSAGFTVTSKEAATHAPE